MSERTTADPLPADDGDDGTEKPRLGLRLRGFSWFSSEARSERRRRPTDAVLLAVCLLVLSSVLPFAPGPTDVDTSLTQAVENLPVVLQWVFAAIYAVGTAWALIVMLVPLFVRGRRALSALLLGSALLGFGATALAGFVAGTDWSDSLGSLLGTTDSPVFTAARMAVVTSVLVTASPYLSHPARLVGRIVLALMAVAAVAVESGYPIGVAAAMLAGAAAGSALHLVYGSPGGRPSSARVVGALADFGYDDAEAEYLPTSESSWTAFTATVAGRPPMRVSVLGRDERDAQAFSSAWRAATRRGEHLRLMPTRLARVEHAAMVTLMAERAGVRVLPLVVAGRSAEGDALLVTEAPQGPALADVPPAWLSDELLDDVWRQARALHDAGIAHGHLDTQCIVLDAAGRPAVADLVSGRLAAPPRDIMIDRVRLLTSLALAAGIEKAVASAQRVLGADGLRELLPYVQRAVLDGDTRAAVEDAEWELGDLRGAVVAATGEEAPPLEQLSRVSGRSLARAVIIVLVAYTLISMLAGVDFAEVWAELQSADWSWLVAALIVAPFANVLSAFSTLGATTAALRYYPVLMLQFALQFIAVALPATAARVAMDVRFFQSFGVTPGAAMSIGVIDSFSGFVVQVILLAVILLSGLPGFTEPFVGSTDSSSGDSGDSDPSLLALTLVIGLVSLLVVLVVPRLRHRYAARARGVWDAMVEQARNARGTLEVLRHPFKVLEMLLGNLGGQVVQAVALGLCLMAFGESAALSQLILINTAVSLFAGLMPVPGGVGVAEAGLTAGLQAIGIPAPVAMSTAIAFRLVTFYLPPLWSGFAMRWLRHNSYV